MSATYSFFHASDTADWSSNQVVALAASGGGGGGGGGGSSQWSSIGTNVYVGTGSNVGIGNAAPAYALDVTGQVHASAGFAGLAASWQSSSSTTPASAAALSNAYVALSNSAGSTTALAAASNAAFASSNQAFVALPARLGAASNQAIYGSNQGAAFASAQISAVAGQSNTVGLMTKFSSNVAVNGTLTVNNLTYLYSNVTVFNAEEVRSNLVVQGTSTLSNAYSSVALATSNGGLGVGTASPAYALDVAGQVRASGGFVGLAASWESSSDTMPASAAALSNAFVSLSNYAGSTTVLSATSNQAFLALPPLVTAASSAAAAASNQAFLALPPLVTAASSAAAAASNQAFLALPPLLGAASNQAIYGSNQGAAFAATQTVAANGSNTVALPTAFASDLNVVGTLRVGGVVYPPTWATFSPSALSMWGKPSAYLTAAASPSPLPLSLASATTVYLLFPSSSNMGIAASFSNAYSIVAPADGLYHVAAFVALGSNATGTVQAFVSRNLGLSNDLSTGDSRLIATTIATAGGSPVIELSGMAMLKSGDLLSLGMLAGGDDGSGAASILDFNGLHCGMQLTKPNGVTAWNASADGTTVTAPPAANVGLGGQSAPAYTLDVTGQIRATGGFVGLEQSYTGGSTSNPASAFALSNAYATLSTQAGSVGAVATVAAAASNQAFLTLPPLVTAASATAAASSNQAFLTLPAQVTAASATAAASSNQAFVTLPPLVASTTVIAIASSNQAFFTLPAQVAAASSAAAAASNQSLLTLPPLVAAASNAAAAASNQAFLALPPLVTAASNAAAAASNQAFLTLPPLVASASNAAAAASNQAFLALPPLVAANSNAAFSASNLSFPMQISTVAGQSNTVGLMTKFSCNVAINGTLTVNNLTYLYSNVTVFNAEDVRSNLIVEGTATLSNASGAVPLSVSAGGALQLFSTAKFTFGADASLTGSNIVSLAPYGSNLALRHNAVAASNAAVVQDAGGATTINGGAISVLVGSGGFVGIGATPTYPLQVFTPQSTNGLAVFNSNLTNGQFVQQFLGQSGTSSNSGVVKYTHYGSNSSNLVQLAVWGSPGISCIANGNVGIGTTSPAAPLQVTSSNANGQSILATYDIVGYSDARLKTDLLRIDGALDKVKRLSGYTFLRKDFDSAKRFAGVIAQEVKEVLPEVVSTDADGMLSVAYGNLVALLIEAIKELAATKADAAV